MDFNVWQLMANYADACLRLGVTLEKRLIYKLPLLAAFHMYVIFI